jgi:molecular chaperone HtpG
MSNQEKYEFKSEARQLLDLMIHSVYSNKEVFLRELISNASDALDRLRLEAITDKSLHADGRPLEIRVEADPEARTLSLHDTGIGMGREELIEHLGTIARSGTKEFIARLEADQAAERPADAALIGQFGVGFYSAFMVADRVEVVTRKAGTDAAFRWVSTGDGTYTIESAEREQPGSTVTLHLRASDEEDGLADFTSEWTLREVIKKHSDFVTYPILLKQTKKAADEDGESKEGREDVVSWRTVNSMKAIWTRPEKEVKDEEYDEFYKHLSRDWQGPLTRVAFKAEGTMEYAALLFVPQTPPVDLYWREGQFGLALYVNRVLIMERCEPLLPSYLRFVKGVVDSPDLSLNVSREMLQQDRRLTQIRKRVVKKVLDTLGELQKDAPEKYAGFWESFGRVLKEGVLQDREAGDAIKPLLMFASSHSEEGLTTLDAYIERMKEGQEAIYFITGESRAAVEKSPHLEALRAKGYEVLYLVEPVDELVAESLREYRDKPLQSVGKGTVELGTEEERKQAEEKREEAEKRHKSLLEAIQTALDAHVKEVRLSTRLTTSPACLVGEVHDMSPQMERLLEQAGQKAPKQKRILELNPDHALLSKMNTLHIADEKEKLVRYAELVYGQALLAEGSPLPDPVAFNALLTEVMVGG